MLTQNGFLSDFEVPGSSCTTLQGKAVEFVPKFLTIWLHWSLKLSIPLSIARASMVVLHVGFIVSLFITLAVLLLSSAFCSRYVALLGVASTFCSEGNVVTSKIGARVVLECILGRNVDLDSIPQQEAPRFVAPDGTIVSSAPVRVSSNAVSIGSSVATFHHEL
jgi:hypothetical protein